MKRMLVSAALLLSGFASALTTAQREQHLKEVFFAAGIPLAACPAPETGAVRLCGQTVFGDSIARDSWDLYAASRSKVTFTAIHDRPWKLNPEGTVYSSRFVMDDDDTYVIVVTARTSGSYLYASWAEGKPAAGNAAAPAPAAVPAASTPAAPAPVTPLPAAPVPAAASAAAAAPAAALPAAPAEPVSAPTAPAPTAPVRPMSECAPGAIVVSNISGTVWLSATWYQDASFPNPAQQFTRGSSGTNYSKTCPTFDVTFDLRKGEYIFKGQTFDDVVMYSGLARYSNINSISMLDRSNLLQISNLGITYDKFNKVYKIMGTDTYNFTLTAMGYRVDGGSLQPLYFQGKIYDMVVPASAKTLEVYTQPSASTGWQYLKLDIPASTLTMERTYPFPAK